MLKGRLAQSCERQHILEFLYDAYITPKVHNIYILVLLEEYSAFSEESQNSPVRAKPVRLPSPTLSPYCYQSTMKAGASRHVDVTKIP